VRYHDGGYLTQALALGFSPFNTTTFVLGVLPARLTPHYHLWTMRLQISFIFSVVPPQLTRNIPVTRPIETRSLPALTRCCPRSFTFYVAHPVRSIVSQLLPQFRPLPS